MRKIFEDHPLAKMYIIFMAIFSFAFTLPSNTYPLYNAVAIIFYTMLAILEFRAIFPFGPNHTIISGNWFTFHWLSLMIVGLAGFKLKGFDNIYFLGISQYHWKIMNATAFALYVFKQFKWPLKPGD